MNFRKSHASSGFFEPLEMPSPCELGVAQKPGMCATPSVSGVTQLPCPLKKKYAGECACSMPTLPAAKAPLGSTQRPVQEILLMAFADVDLASLSSTSAALGVLNAVFFRSGVTSSTPFSAKSGQYSQSKFSVMKPVESPLVIFCACTRIS